MRLHTMICAALIAGAFAAPLRAQDTTAKKPSGLSKVAHDVSATSKKAGKDAKAEVKRDASKTHDALKTAGNETKTATGNATGIHKIGGDVGAAAQSVSHASKKTAADAKSDLKQGSSDAHARLTKAGKAVKDTTKKP